MAVFAKLSNKERERRKALVELLLTQGYSPIRSTVGRGSATEQADRLDGKASGTYARWVRDEEKRQRKDKDYVLPNWLMFRPAQGTMPTTATVDTEEVENLDARADLLRAEIVRLVTESDYPIINIGCITVSTTLTKRFDRKTASYKTVPSTPRTWLNDTPIVQPIKDCRNRKFLFTAAQNDADLHLPFWRNLQAYAAHIGAQIIVGPLTYETTWWSENSTTARSYAKELRPYLCFGQLAIGDDFVFAGEANILATASQPVTDMQTYGRNRWCVVPHGKRQMKSVPSTDPNVQAKQVSTTGMVTKPKLIPRKTGMKSLFHNVIGATIVEFDAMGRIFCRQITAKSDGSFYDLTQHVDQGTVTDGHRVKAIVYGDIHLRKLDALNALGAFGQAPDLDARNYGSMLDVLRPEYIMLHDVFDHETRSHHRADDPCHAHEMAIRGRDSVASEIYDVGRFLESFQGRETKPVVVESNHDLALNRWVMEGRYRFDGPNVAWGLALETALVQHRTDVAAAKDKAVPSPKFSLLQNALTQMNATWISHVEWAFDGGSYLVDGIEVGHHGFRGANGAKGTVSGYARMGRKMTIADKHSPEIMDGVYVAGSMQLQQGYNRGPSGWAVAHVIQYADGHRCIVTMQDGAWRSEKPRISVGR